jgi:hypothetical protein
MINLFDQRKYFSINLSEIFDETAPIERSSNHDIKAVVVTMHVLTFVPIRQQREVMSGFEAVCSANPRLYSSGRAI